MDVPEREQSSELSSATAAPKAARGEMQQALQAAGNGRLCQEREGSREPSPVSFTPGGVMPWEMLQTLHQLC